MTNFNYLYNPNAAKNIFSKKRFVDKQLGFSVIENGTILPYKKKVNGKTTKDGWGFGGIVDSNGEYIKNSFVHYGVGESYSPPATAIIRSSETVIYLGMFHSTWGHILTDNIRRLWFLKSEEFNTNFKKCPLVYLLCTKREVFTLESYKNFRRLLEILDVDVDNLQPITQPTRFDKIILPDESFYLEGVRKFTEEYREMIDRLRNFALKNRTPTSAKKIYYFHGARQLGEERLAEYFRSKGYEIVQPEKLSLNEQLNILINAENFASTLGSISHNSIFLRDKAETIFIPRVANVFNGYQPVIDQVHPLNINYVDSSMSLLNVLHNAFCFVISEQLKKFFGDKWTGYAEEDFKIFLQYYKACTERGLTVNLELLEGYGTVFQDFMAQLKQHKDLITNCGLPPRWEEFRPLLIYQTHVGKKGWSKWIVEDQISNPLDQQLDIQAIKINFPDHKVYYSVYYNDAEGWLAEVAAPEPAGTIGKAKSIFGVRIRLDEAGTKNFDILYRVHTFDGNWTLWAKNGETLYSHGVKLNAIQIKLETKT